MFCFGFVKENTENLTPTKKRKVNPETAKFATNAPSSSPSHLWKQQITDLKSKLAAAESRADALSNVRHCN
jgi:hypothetical protein